MAPKKQTHAGGKPLPWLQPLQALAEVVVEEEVQGLHALSQALPEGHWRGAGTHTHTIKTTQ